MENPGVLHFFCDIMREVPDAGIIDHLMVLLRRHASSRIEGDSMLPVLSDGDRVVVDPLSTPAVGDIVVAYHPYKKSVSIVKRVVEIMPAGSFILIGDNLDESTDSRSFGAIAADDIFGKVVSKFR